MDEWAVNNMSQNMEKTKKKHKKDKGKKKRAKGIEEEHNVDSTKAAESARMPEKEGTAEENRDHKMGKEKKKKRKRVKDAEVDMNNGSREDDLAERNGEICGGLTMDKAERKRMKRGKKKNKKEKFQMHEGSINGPDGGSVSGKESGKKVVEEKEDRKMKRTDSKEGDKNGELSREHGENCSVNATGMSKKRKRDSKNRKDDNTVESVQLKISPENAKTNHEKKKKKKHKGKENHKDDLAAVQEEYPQNGSENGRDIEAESASKGKKRKPSLVINGSDGTSPNKSNKKVRFSDQDEVFPLPSNSNTKEGDAEDNLVRGKRFTHEEDDLVKDAVLKYIDEHELGDEGLGMVLNCRKHPELKGCWKEIGSVIPYRPYNAVYYRARILFMRSEERKWTQEEYDIIKKFQEEHGNNWKELADTLGKHPWHVKDTWRRIKLDDLKKGRWSQEEYQKLFDLVNTDLQLKLSEEKKSKHGMLRDNIAWTAISDALSTRNHVNCSIKWYRRLTSSMVAEGVWSDSDDYRMLRALYSLDATCMEDVEWDDLIDGRSGDVCRKRWSQMVLHIGHHGSKSFAEQVEVLAQRYCPHLLEAREAWANKERVP